MNQRKIDRANEEFIEMSGDLRNDNRVLAMKKFIQHGRITTYDHCYRVAKMSYILARSFRMRNIDEKALIRAAFLHDYFLYDWHNHVQEKDPDIIWPGRMIFHFFHMHGFTHPKEAADNAIREFGISKKEADIIRSHMWPLTFTYPPRSKEAVLVCMADKIISTQETLFMR